MNEAQCDSFGGLKVCQLQKLCGDACDGGH